MAAIVPRARTLTGMKHKPLDPRRLDVAALAQRAEQLSGEWPLADLERLADAAVTSAPTFASSVVRWQVTGDARPVKGGAAEIWMHIAAEVTLPLCCQLCLGPVATEVTVDRWLRFVADETQAAALDADSEDDVLALSRELDVRELIEDELLLELPLVPTHEDECPEPLPRPADDLDETNDETPAANPFAALAALRKPN
ncbi:YceD family protein [Vitreoscilla filiformis]|nr:YceD family protein [Vitreoscilla filiformis]